MHSNKAFTLIEILIVISVFSIISLVSVNGFFTSFNMTQRTSVENAILEDARFILSSLTREIQNGTIDFEEYFNQCVVSGGCPNKDLNAINENDWLPVANFGNGHGYYNWQFWYGGYYKDGDPTTTDGYGPV
jgi:prepilin-type N-terminal cleavage/methylation domain-containing protein